MLLLRSYVLVCLAKHILQHILSYFFELDNGPPLLAPLIVDGINDILVKGTKYGLIHFRQLQGSLAAIRRQGGKDALAFELKGGSFKVRGLYCIGKPEGELFEGFAIHHGGGIST